MKHPRNIGEVRKSPTRYRVHSGDKDGWSHSANVIVGKLASELEWVDERRVYINEELDKYNMFTEDFELVKPRKIQITVKG